jgi:putative PIN family toxin of toxin-antitoxin system
VLRAVLDANVYISALIRPAGPPGQVVQRFLRDEAFDLVLSPAIVDETLRAFSYPKVRKCIPRDVDPALWFEGIIILARLVAGERTVQPLSADPDDDKYIAAAIEGGATFIVSGDPDLLTLGEHDGVRIVTPRAFLGMLGA